MYRPMWNSITNPAIRRESIMSLTKPESVWQIWNKPARWSQWSAVSNAALRSSRTSVETSPLYEALSGSGIYFDEL